jgi:hypothetical protein
MVLRGTNKFKIFLDWLLYDYYTRHKNSNPAIGWNEPDNIYLEVDSIYYDKNMPDEKFQLLVKEFNQKYPSLNLKINIKSFIREMTRFGFSRKAGQFHKRAAKVFNYRNQYDSLSSVIDTRDVFSHYVVAGSHDGDIYQNLRLTKKTVEEIEESIKYHIYKLQILKNHYDKITDARKKFKSDEYMKASTKLQKDYLRKYRSERRQTTDDGDDKVDDDDEEDDDEDDDDEDDYDDKDEGDEHNQNEAMNAEGQPVAAPPLPKKQAPPPPYITINTGLRQKLANDIIQRTTIVWTTSIQT